MNNTPIVAMLLPVTEARGDACTEADEQAMYSVHASLPYLGGRGVGGALLTIY